jgi:selenide, water dikinase
MALAILGMPLGKLSVESVREILAGGASVCAEAGIPVAGGHSIDSPEPIYGLAVIGLAKPQNVRRNAGARDGDALILTKGIGVGVYSAAFKKRELPEDAYAEFMASTTLLNRVGQTLGENSDVHAITDVTGFGILGHALEVARGSGVGVEIVYDQIPLLSHAEALAKAGYVTGASGRNWASYGHDVVLPNGLAEWQKSLLTDPQTSGGLLVSCAADKAESIHAQIKSAGYPMARIVGSVTTGSPQVRIV